ncbi:DUF4190 domain-containing protein [Cellulomonas cellasea]|uniref:DUF4190 domain-containing protein n=2 Tax=Cellulomonas cellasea TaxID=43670 RepID=A0A0A0B4T3_9CELL|nr:DUF4190 domain-containing protein [Cellulomonas cellasea]KGM00819.1 hypothetical protein Q760_05875 [Cellulomonas cellasea DSM 20118]GEA90053.1 hypothetical protein CCE01nite_40020 [Cellulomonas cellasea]
MTTPGDPTPQDPATARDGRSAPTPDGTGTPPAAGHAPIDLTKPRGTETASGAPAPASAAPGQAAAGEPPVAQPYAQGQPGAAQPAAQPYARQYAQGQPYAGQPYPGQPYPGQPYPGQPYAPAYVYPKNQLGVWSLVLGIVGIVVGCVFVTGIPAVILGNNAKRAVAAGEANNLGMAQAGIVLGWISIALGVVALGFVVLYVVGVAGVLGLSFLSNGTGY